MKEIPCFMCTALYHNDPTHPIKNGIRKIKLRLFPNKTTKLSSVCEEHNDHVPTDQDIVDVDIIASYN